MKKKLIILAFILLGLGIFGAVLSNSNWDEITSILGQITIGKFLLFLALTQISYALFNLRWKIILKTHGHDIPFWKLWLYRASGYGVSYITPTQIGGEPVRIYLLNENHGISLRESTATVLFDKLIELATFVAFVASGVVVVSYANLLPRSSMIPILGFIGVIGVFSVYVFKKLLDGTGFLTTCFKAMKLDRFKRLRSLEGKIFRVEKLIMDFLSHDQHKKTTLPLIVFISLLAWSCTIVEYFILAKFLGISLTVFQSFLVGTVPLMAYMIPVPAGLGMLEGAQAGMFSLFGYSTSVALAVVVMVRVKELFFSSIGFIYVLTHGLTLLGKRTQTPEIIETSPSKPRKIKKPDMRRKRVVRAHV